MGDQPAAEHHFRRALTLAPALPESHFYLARWLVERGRGPEAVEHLREAARLSPAFGDARELLMDLLAARGDTAGAVALAGEYLAIDGTNVRARSYASGVSPVHVAPADYATYFRHGLDLGARGLTVESALAYRGALGLDPESADALNNLGWTLGILGFLEEAVPYVEGAVRLRPDFTLARNNLAWVRSRLRDV